MTTLKVFISSRMSELAAERQAVADLLPTLDFNGIRLETWRFETDAPASSKTIREVYLDALYNSDLVIGLFWKTLGEWTADEIMKSGERNIERHIYIKKTRPDSDEDQSPELRQFLEWQHHDSVRFGFTTKWFYNTEELLESVRFSIEQWLLTRQMTQNSVSAVMVRSPLDVPDQARRLIGREALVMEALDALAYGDQVLLNGLGGVGKSVTAAEIAVQYMEQSQKYVMWVEVGDAQTLQVFDAMTKVLGTQRDLSALSRLEREQQIRHMLKDIDALIVFDDVWNGITLQDVLRAVPRDMPVLATSRLRIPLDTIINVAPLSQEAAFEMLSYHSRIKNLAEDPAAERLIGLLGAHPYALEIAGRTLRVDRIDAATMVERIAQAPHRIKMPANFGEAGRTGIKSLLDASIDVLSPNLHMTFMVMGGLFQPMATAELVARTLHQNPDSVEKNLNDLVERGLVEKIERESVEYYRLHDLAYSYAGTLLAAEMKTWKVEDLILACRDFADVHRENVHVLDIEQGNLLEAASRAITKEQPKVLVDLMDALIGTYLTSRGYSLKFLELLSAAIDMMKIHGFEPAQLHRFYSKQGNILYHHGNYEAALGAYQAALDIARVEEMKTREVVLLASVGKVYAQLHDPQAIPVLEQAEALAQELDDEYWLGMVYEMQGFQAQVVEDYERCREIYQQNVALGRRIEDPVTEFFALLNLGSAELHLQSFEDARSFHQQALELAQQHDILPWVALAYFGLGQDHHGLGDAESAGDYLNKSIRIFKKHGLFARVQEVKQYMDTHGYKEVEN